jgi:hypothetical protein
MGLPANLNLPMLKGFETCILMESALDLAPNEKFLLQWKSNEDYLVEDSVGGLVAGQGLLAEVLVGLGQAFHLSKPRVQRHCRMCRILKHLLYVCKCLL